jgi:hypothetical protein
MHAHARTRAHTHAASFNLPSTRPHLSHASA